MKVFDMTRAEIKFRNPIKQNLEFKDASVTIKDIKTVNVYLKEIGRNITGGYGNPILFKEPDRETVIRIGDDGKVSFDAPVDFDQEIAKMTNREIAELISKCSEELIKRNKASECCVNPCSETKLEF